MSLRTSDRICWFQCLPGVLQDTFVNNINYIMLEYVIMLHHTVTIALLNYRCQVFVSNFWALCINLIRRVKESSLTLVNCFDVGILGSYQFCLSQIFVIWFKPSCRYVGWRKLSFNNIHHNTSWWYIHKCLFYSYYFKKRKFSSGGYELKLLGFMPGHMGGCRR